MRFLPRSVIQTALLFSFLFISLLIASPRVHAGRPSALDDAAIIANIPTVESLHPYLQNETGEWTVDNITGMDATRLYFKRIDLEDSIDRIELYDEHDLLVQTITGSAPDGLWSQIVPGSLIKIKLITDENVQSWGFEANRIEGASYATLARSPHPYPNEFDDTQFLLNDVANPQGTRVHFDHIDLEDKVDYIIIKDSDGNPYQWITGAHDEFSSKTVPGAAVQVQLLSDRTVNSWGYNIDAVESAPPDTPDTPPSFDQVLAETTHPISGSYSNSWTIVNPDPLAVNSKIHFSQLSLSRYDTLKILDADDNLVDYFNYKSGGYNIWTYSVPGRIVKIDYSKSKWYDNWGFRVDSIITADSTPVLAESPHPYPSGIHQTWTIVNPDPFAVTTKVHFEDLHIAGYDELYLIDEHDLVIQQFNGSMSATDLWSDYVTGRIVKLLLHESDHYEGWGFRVDAVSSGPELPALAESPHPYPSGIHQTWTIVNPDSSAAQTKVLFERMDIAGYDLLTVLDADDNEIQSFGGGTHLRHFWSDYVPGRTFKVRLDESDHYEDWGFRVTDLYTAGSPPPDPAYVSGLYLALTQLATVTVDDDVVIQAQSPGEYKIALDEVGEYLIKIQYAAGEEIFLAIRKEDGSLQILPETTKPQAVIEETVTHVALTLSDDAIVYLDDEELINAESAGEYKISLADISADPGHYLDLQITHHEHSQDLNIIAGKQEHHIYLPGILR